jgi:hypothetical protein
MVTDVIFVLTHVNKTLAVTRVNAPQSFGMDNINFHHMAAIALSNR